MPRRPHVPHVRLNAHLRRQRALLTVRQVQDAGVSPEQLKLLVKRGQYRRMRRGVVVLDGAPLSWEQTVHAAVMSAGPGVLVAGMTAARLLGCKVPDTDVIEIVAPRPRRVRLDGVRGHRSLHLFDDDRSVRHGIPCTSPARTLVDLSSRLDDRALSALADDLQRRGLLRLADLHRCGGRLRSAPGRSMARIHRLLEARWPGYDPGDSDLETRILRCLVSAGLPVPRQQHRMKVEARRRYFDLAWPELRLAVEVDSEHYHGQAGARREDRLKGNDAAKLGWTLVRVDDRMSDAEVLAEVVPVFERLTAASA